LLLKAPAELKAQACYFAGARATTQMALSQLQLMLIVTQFFENR
jgi:hypothetical protein